MSDARRLVWALALGTGLFYLAFLPPGIYSIDGNSMLGVAESIVTQHNLTVAAGLGIPGRAGQLYSSWYPLQSFVAVPFVAAARIAAGVAHVPFHYVAAVFASVLPAVFTAATVALVALTALQLGSTLQGARRASLCFAFGTMAMVYARTFYAEPLLMLLIAGAVCLVFTGVPRRILFAASLTLLAVLAKPTGIFLGPALSVYLFLKKTPVRLALAPAFGSGIGLLFYFLYNFARFGNPLTFGQPWAFALSTIPQGIAGLLVSPGRGIIWYCPPILLAIPGIRRAAKDRQMETLLIVALFAGFLMLHSCWSFWSGGWSWGPRFLLPVLPAVMAFTGLLEGRAAKALLVLAFVGFVANAPTLVSFYERYYAEANERGVSEDVLIWSPRSAPVLHTWGAASRVISDARSQDVRELFRQAGPPSGTIASSRALRVVAVWWWVLPVAHIPRWIGAACSFAMVSLGFWLVLRVKL